SQSAPCGTFSSRTMIVMRIAITPSLNASSRPLVTGSVESGLDRGSSRSAAGWLSRGPLPCGRGTVGSCRAAWGAGAGGGGAGGAGGSDVFAEDDGGAGGVHGPLVDFDRAAGRGEQRRRELGGAIGVGRARRRREEAGVGVVDRVDLVLHRSLADD